MLNDERIDLIATVIYDDVYGDGRWAADLLTYTDITDYYAEPYILGRGYARAIARKVLAALDAAEGVMHDPQ